MTSATPPPIIPTDTPAHRWTPREILALAVVSGRSVPTARRWARGQRVRQACDEDLRRAARTIGVAA